MLVKPLPHDREQHAFAVRQPMGKPMAELPLGFVRGCQNLRASAVRRDHVETREYSGCEHDLVIRSPTGFYRRCALITQSNRNTTVDRYLHQFAVSVESDPPVIRREKRADSTFRSRNGLGFQLIGSAQIQLWFVLRPRIFSNGAVDDETPITGYGHGCIGRLVKPKGRLQAMLSTRKTSWPLI